MRRAGLTALLLLLACSGERRESAAGESEGAAVTDTAPAPAGDTAAVASASDTATKQAESPAQPAAPAKPTAPPKPSKPQPSAPTPAAPAPATPKPEPTTPARDTAPQPAEPQTGTEPLRDAYHQAPKDTVDQTTYDGWKQFNLNCARCHGEDVLGTTIAPHLIMSLKPDGPINTQEAFVQVVCAGRPEKGMPAWCSLGMDPAKINQIYSYVKGRSEGKIGPGRPAVKQEG